MKKLLLLFCFGLSLISVKGQNPDRKRTNHWYFGHGAGIDFSSGSAVTDTTGHLHTSEGCAVMSDTLGNLLCYSDGDTVWDRHHNVMPNGYGLLGCGQYGSTAQACVIIPYPGNANKYIVFTNDCQENLGGSGLRYTVVNMLLNFGNGDVDTSQKNILLFAPSTEGLGITYKCNKKDFWIVAHEFNNNKFHVYSVDSNGINNIPQIVSIGSPYTYNYSMFRFSSNGAKLATAYRHPPATDVAMLFDFNNQTGVISNGIQLVFNSSGFSPEFSFDNTKLYYNVTSTSIQQFDISSGNDSASINSTRVVVATNSSGLFGYLAKAPNNKIYIPMLSTDSLSTIDLSNVSGIGCSIHQMSFYTGRLSTPGLPEFVADYYYQGVYSNDCTEGIDEITLEDIKIFPNPASDYLQIEGNNIQNIQLYDVVGKIIFQNNEINSMYSTKIMTNKLSNGIYIFKINTNNKLITKKIIKQ